MNGNSPILEVEELNHVYEDGTRALNKVNLSIFKGEFLALLGANGSGKTTLIKHLNGLLKPYSGQVLFNGKPVQSVTDSEVFSKIGIVFQDPDDQLFAATVQDDVAFGPINMRLPKQEVSRRVREALLQVEMLDFANKSIHALSHGQKKRACIAGVLSMGPEIIILDEPTDGLDPMGAQSLMRHLRFLNKQEGITMLMATHAVDLVPLFMDRVCIMKNGEVFRSGTPAEVFADPEAVAEAKLQLPIVAELMHLLKIQDQVSLRRLPLTIGEARTEILHMLTRGGSADL